MMRWIVHIRLAAAALVLAASALTTGGTIMAQSEAEIEQPPFDVIDTVGYVEIRQYGPRLAAEADMEPGSSIERAQYSAFMALADFIFAKNRQGPEVAMTAPVAIENAAEPIAMTAPVAIEPGEEGRVMRFFMPAAYTIATLPRPGDDQVRIVTVPAQTLAVLRFSGEADDAEVANRKAELLAALQGGAWRPVGEPGLFGYDPPLTPPERRRNEVYVEVAPITVAGTAEQPLEDE
jgi:hypothetical protein